MINADLNDRDWGYHKSIVKKCVAPWHSLTINWTGDVFADAIAKLQYGNLYDKTLSEF